MKTRLLSLSVIFVVPVVLIALLLSSSMFATAQQVPAQVDLPLDSSVVGSQQPERILDTATWLFEDFNDGIANGFQSVQIWLCSGSGCSSYSVTNGQYVIYGANDMASRPAAIVGEETWQYYSLEADLALGYIDGTVGSLLANVQPYLDGFRLIEFEIPARGDYWSVYARDRWVQAIGIASGSMPINSGQNYHMKLVTLPDNTVQVCLDGSLLGGGSIPQGWPVAGKAGIGVGEAYGYFDNFLVSGSPRKATATVAPTVPVTLTIPNNWGQIPLPGCMVTGTTTFTWTQLVAPSQPLTHTPWAGRAFSMVATDSTWSRSQPSNAPIPSS